VTAGFGLDKYDRNARLKPALTAALPAAWTVMAWSPGNALGWGGLWGLIVGAGGTFLLAQMARDRGKRKERALFDRFGGRPSERMLSYAAANNTVQLAQRHEKLSRLMPGVSIPTEEDEVRDPYAAQQIYGACVAFLISRTRDDRLLFQENMNYGFRRNLWGLKPIGIVVAGGAAAVLGLRLFMEFSTHSPVAALLVSFEALNLGMIGAWLFWFIPSWVMIPSRAYAERLMEALDRM
jgi:hypothetical protein